MKKITFLFEFGDESGGKFQCLLIEYESGVYALGDYAVWLGADMLNPSPAEGAEIEPAAITCGGEGISVLAVGAGERETMRRALLSLALGAELMTKAISNRFYKGK